MNFRALINLDLIYVFDIVLLFITEGTFVLPNPRSITGAKLGLIITTPCLIIILLPSFVRSFVRSFVM